MRRIPLAVFAALALLSYVAQSAQSQCVDILFAVDTSTSIGSDKFEYTKQFLKMLVQKNIHEDSKIGFILFATEVDFSRHITTWGYSELDQYVSGLSWTQGYANTPGAIQQALFEFRGQNTSYVPHPLRQKILMMITDGYPCLPSSLGGCPQSVCEYEAQIKAEGIRVVIIGVGDGLTTTYTLCLTQSNDDFMQVASFAPSDFDSIFPPSNVSCPVEPDPTISPTKYPILSPTKDPTTSPTVGPVLKDFKVTEVKAMRKKGALANRLTRFVEFYNHGVEFNLNAVVATGLIAMPNGGPDVTVAQGTYVVFYDAADNPFPSMPTCHLCGDDCTLSSCSIAGQASDSGYCWCQNSIYVACGNDASSDCSQGLYQDAGTLPANGCSLCTFSNSQDKTSWNIQFLELNTDTLIDGVTYTGAPEWITSTDGFSYELISKGLINDYGANWVESCNELGTPGADPYVLCLTKDPTNDPTISPFVTSVPTQQATDSPAGVTSEPTTSPAVKTTTAAPTENPSATTSATASSSTTPTPSTPTPSITYTPSAPADNASNEPTSSTASTSPTASAPTSRPSYPLHHYYMYTTTSLPFISTTSLTSTTVTNAPSSTTTKSSTTNATSSTTVAFNLDFVLRYTDKPWSSYYHFFLLASQYAQILNDAVIGSLSSVSGHSAMYSDDDIWQNKPWNRAGIIHFDVCRIFSDIELDDDDCREYEANAKDEYVSVAPLTVTADEGLAEYVQYLREQVTSAAFYDMLGAQVNDALNTITDGGRRRMRSLLTDNNFEVVSIVIIDPLNDLSTTQDEDTSDKTGDGYVFLLSKILTAGGSLSNMIYIIVGCAILLLVTCICVCCCCKKRSKSKREQIADNEEQIEIAEQTAAHKRSLDVRQKKYDALLVNMENQMNETVALEHDSHDDSALPETNTLR